jgi:hypothetical protein
MIVWVWEPLTAEAGQEQPQSAKQRTEKIWKTSGQ